MWRLWLVHYCARRGLLGTWCSGTPVMAWGCAPAPGGFSSSLALLFFPRWAPARSLTFGNVLQLSTMDVLACASRKGAAKCDKHCELQNSVNQQTPERIRHLRVSPQVGLIQCFERDWMTAFPPALPWGGGGTVVVVRRWPFQRRALPQTLRGLRSAHPRELARRARGLRRWRGEVCVLRLPQKPKHAVRSDYPLNLSI